MLSIWTRLKFLSFGKRVNAFVKSINSYQPGHPMHRPQFFAFFKFSLYSSTILHHDLVGCLTTGISWTHNLGMSSLVWRIDHGDALRPLLPELGSYMWYKREKFDYLISEGLFNHQSSFIQSQWPFHQQSYLFTVLKAMVFYKIVGKENKRAKMALDRSPEFLRWP